MFSLKSLKRWPFDLLILVSLVLWAVSVIGTFQLLHRPFPGFRFESTLTVSAVNEPTWNGPKAGLQQYDRLLRVNGHELKTPAELWSFVRSQPVGTPLHYDFLREKKPHTVAVSTQPFHLTDWFKSFSPLLLVGLLHLLVGAAAFWLKPNNLTSQVHLLMNAVVCVYCASGTDYDASALLARFYILTIPLLGSTFLHLGLVFPDVPHWLAKRKWLNLLPYLPVALLVPYWQTVFRAEGALVNPTRFDTHMAVQDLAILWLMIGLLSLIGSILFRVFRGKQALIKQQAKVALFGAALAYLPGGLLWIIPYLANNQSLDSSGVIVNLSFACFVFFPVSIAYAIVRHKMFDIDLVIKRTVVYTTVVASLTGVYFLTISLVRGAINVLFHAQSSDLGNILATAIVAIAFVPVRNAIQTLIDKIFYRNRYDFRAVLSEYTKFTKENPELDAVVEQYVALVDKSLHPRHMSIMVRDPKTNALQVYREAGLSLFPLDFSIAPDAPEVRELLSARRTGMRPSHATTKHLVHMNALGIAFCVPLEIKGEILGLINMGPKLSELDYTAEDQGLLINMGQQLASVIRIAEMTKKEVERARLDAELEVARGIQASLLPREVEAPEGLEVVGSSVSALEFGGDYYDLLTLQDGQLRVVVGDVAGKGVQAAMVMAMAKSCFYNQVRQNPDLPTVMKAINSMILETISDKKHRKTTLVYGVIDPAQRMLRYASAGHQPPHYFNAESGKVEELPIQGSFPFGASKLAKYQEVDVSLHAGDVLVFYTDGLTEAENANHEMFYRIEEGPDGEDIVHDRLTEVLELHHSKPAAEIHLEILKAVEAWTQGHAQGDDITLVVVKMGA